MNVKSVQFNSALLILKLQFKPATLINEYMHTYTHTHIKKEIKTLLITKLHSKKIAIPIINK